MLSWGVQLPQQLRYSNLNNIYLRDQPECDCSCWALLCPSGQHSSPAAPVPARGCSAAHTAQEPPERKAWEAVGCSLLCAAWNHEGSRWSFSSTAQFPPRLKIKDWRCLFHEKVDWGSASHGMLCMQSCQGPMKWLDRIHGMQSC